jgi:glutamyl-tRNA synthetase
MVNYLARLGWSHGDQEIFTREELIRLFDIKDVASSGAVFDLTKLEWLNQESIKAMDGGKLAALAQPFIAAAGLSVTLDPGRLARAMETLRERAKTLKELVEVGRFYFERPTEYEAKAAVKFLTAAGAERLGVLVTRLESLPEFTAPAIEAVFRELTEALGLKLVDLAQLTRLAVTGRTASPPLFDVLAVLGRDETVTRLRTAQAVAARVA